MRRLSAGGQFRSEITDVDTEGKIPSAAEMKVRVVEVRRRAAVIHAQQAEQRDILEWHRYPVIEEQLGPPGAPTGAGTNTPVPPYRVLRLITGDKP